MKFVTLLRGINVGGNNKVSMQELKSCLEDAGLSNVSTYINSGNVLFESGVTDTSMLVQKCETAIKKRFGFHVICAVIAADVLRESVTHAPEWWDLDSASKHNALFIIAPSKPEDIMDEIGEVNPEYERVEAVGPIIFWSAPLKTFGRTKYGKIVGTRAYQSITVRNANTTKKLAQLCTED